VKYKTGFKLFRRRKDGTLGPLFINARQRIEVGRTYEAEDHPTKGYAHRPGWHLAKQPVAPHLSTKGRVWCRVQYTGGVEYPRPESQGGCWILARTMRVVEVMQHQK
jgi:hypothetical protein